MVVGEVVQEALIKAIQCEIKRVHCSRPKIILTLSGP